MTNDISIGKDRWIRVPELPDGQLHAIEIDPYLAPVMPFIEKLETECVAECCGIDAFRFWPEEIEKTVATLSQHEVEELVSGLVSVQSEIDRLHDTVVVSTRMNQYLRKSVILEVLTHIRDVVEESRAKFTERGAAPNGGGR